MIPWWSLLIFLPAVFYAGTCLGRWLNADGDWRLKALEKSALAMTERAERASRDAYTTQNATQALLFTAYRTMAGQSRGLQRQRRIINRLRAEAASAKISGDVDGAMARNRAASSEDSAP